MVVRKYGVINVDRIKVNSILIDDPFPENYWPGYGWALVHEGAVPPIANDPGPVYPANIGLQVLSIVPKKVFNIGDFISANGTVFSYVPGLIQQLDANGNPITVSSAPDVKLVDQR